MACYKVEAYDDVVYVNAENEPAAISRLAEVMGKISRNCLTITVEDKLPEGEEYL